MLRLEVASAAALPAAAWHATGGQHQAARLVGQRPRPRPRRVAGSLFRCWRKARSPGLAAAGEALVAGAKAQADSLQEPGPFALCLAAAAGACDTNSSHLQPRFSAEAVEVKEPGRFALRRGKPTAAVLAAALLAAALAAAAAAALAAAVVAAAAPPEV